MNKDVLKTVSIFLILIIVLSNFSYAADPRPHEISQEIEQYFVKGTNSDPSNPDKPTSFDPQALGSNILGILTFLGYGLAICVILITGIQFLTANAQKKAQLKEKLWFILIGVIILAVGIPVYQVVREALMKLR